MKNEIYLIPDHCSLICDIDNNIINIRLYRYGDGTKLEKPIEYKLISINDTYKNILEDILYMFTNFKYNQTNQFKTYHNNIGIFITDNIFLIKNINHNYNNSEYKYEYFMPKEVFTQIELLKDELLNVKIHKVKKLFNINDIGEFSDGYHTFNSLYYQRLILFATLVNTYKNKAWKSKKHEDGNVCFDGNWFIVAIDTPEGSYAYHYENKYYDLFKCKELEKAKHWDGHTDKDVDRLLSLVR